MPGPGNSVPSTVEISAPLHIPCPITSRNRLPIAYSGSTCAGLMSPDITAKRVMSCSVSVRSSAAQSPTLISSNNRFSMKVISVSEVDKEIGFALP